MRNGRFSQIIIFFKIRKSVSTTTSAMLYCGAATPVETLFVFLKGG
jgi:hypothetical protein